MTYVLHLAFYGTCQTPGQKFQVCKNDTQEQSRVKKDEVAAFNEEKIKNGTVTKEISG